MQRATHASHTTTSSQLPPVEKAGLCQMPVQAGDPKNSKLGTPQLLSVPIGCISQLPKFRCNALIRKKQQQEQELLIFMSRLHSAGSSNTDEPVPAKKSQFEWPLIIKRPKRQKKDCDLPPAKLKKLNIAQVMLNEAVRPGFISSTKIGANEEGLAKPFLVLAVPNRLPSLLTVPAAIGAMRLAD